MKVQDKDIRFMRYAIELGKLAQGKTGDNPYVGCVIVKNGKIIGEGNTQPEGLPHAEAMAITNAKRGNYEVNGATLYSTVEPCSFYGRTPSCAIAIIKEKISRVVVGIRDPDSRVNGRGIALLKKAGIQITEEICEGEVRAYLKQWLARWEA
jgi:diaminohydroxyphosphoribosylaminopyrimidine deaminase/5-amino-6-(5-phosphoribosylamino)uracil reductase